MFTKEEIKQGKCRGYHIRECFRCPAKEGTNLLGKLGQEIAVNKDCPKLDKRGKQKNAT